MSKFTKLIAALIIAGAALPAQAAMLVRVSGKGTDAAGCGTAAAPCRTLYTALAQVDAGGYIVVVDPSDFTGANVTKSVTIANESAGAARIFMTSYGLGVMAPGATVRLRGLTMFSSGSNVLVNAVKWLDVADCDFRGFHGIIVNEPSLGRITISNTRFAQTAVMGRAPALFVTNTRMFGRLNYGQFDLANTLPGTAVFKDSILEGDPSWGPEGYVGMTTFNAVTVLRSSVLRNLPIGLSAGSSPFLLSKSTVTANTLAFKTRDNQPLIQSTGDNIIRGNSDDALGVVTPLALH